MCTFYTLDIGSDSLIRLFIIASHLGMSIQGETILDVDAALKPSTPTKGVFRSSQIDCGPDSPVVNGFRQSTIAFKVQRTKVEEKSSLVTANYNITPVNIAIF